MTEPTDVLDTPAAGGQVIRGGVLRVAAYTAGVALSVVAAAFMTRHLGVVDFGRYVVVISLIGIVAGLSEAGLSNIALREYSTRAGGERAQLMANVQGLRLVVGTMGVGAAVVFAIAAGYDPTMVAGTAVFGASALAAVAQQTLVVPLQAGLRFGWVSVLEAVRSSAFVGAVLLLVVLDAGLFAFFLASVPVALLVLGWTAQLVRRFVPLLPRFDRREWGRVLRLAAAYSAASAVGTVYVYAAVLVTSLVASDEETGYLAASFRVFLVLVGIPGLLVSTAFPVLARAGRDDRERLRYATQRLTEVALIVGVWMSLVTVVGADFAIEVVAGDAFAPAADVLRVYGIAVGGAFVALAWGFTLLSLRRHGVVLVAAALALAASIAIALLAVPEVGAEGGALATLVAELAVALLYGAVLFWPGRIMGFEPAVLPRIALSLVLAAGLAWVLPLHDVVEVGAVTVAYVAALFLLGGIPKEVMQALLPARARGGT